MKMPCVCVVQLKTTQPDGVILYSGTSTGRDFLALELFDGQVRYVYDVGGGARTLRVNLRYSVSDNRWHQVAIIRSTLAQVHQPVHVTCCLLLWTPGAGLTQFCTGLSASSSSLLLLLLLLASSQCRI